MPTLRKVDRDVESSGGGVTRAHKQPFTQCCWVEPPVKAASSSVSSLVERAQGSISCDFRPVAQEPSCPFATAHQEWIHVGSGGDGVESVVV